MISSSSRLTTHARTDISELMSDMSRVCHTIVASVHTGPSMFRVIFAEGAKRDIFELMSD